MDTRDAAEQQVEIWHRSQVAAFWCTTPKNLDKWVRRGDERLPAPRRGPGNRPYWLRHEVEAIALRPEHLTDPAMAGSAAGDRVADPSIPQISEEALLKRLGRA